MSPVLWAGQSLASPIDGQWNASAKNPLGDNRILAFCIPFNNETEYEAQKDPHPGIDWEGFVERDLVIVEVRKDGMYVINSDLGIKITPQNQIAKNYLGERLKSVANCGEARKYVLIGKDQTAKRRWENFPSFDELYSLIDAMPMRRYEMKMKANKD